MTPLLFDAADATGADVFYVNALTNTAPETMRSRALTSSSPPSIDATWKASLALAVDGSLEDVTLHSQMEVLALQEAINRARLRAWPARTPRFWSGRPGSTPTPPSLVPTCVFMLLATSSASVCW
jgi:hypothetical protein